MEIDHGCKNEKKKRPRSLKVLDLALRSCHVGAASVLFGGLVLAVPFSRVAGWHMPVIVTGGCLMVAEACRSRHWIYQVRGLMAVLHLGLLGLVHYRADLLVPALTAVLLSGVIGSNLPGSLRHWSVVHRQKMD